MKADNTIPWPTEVQEEEEPTSAAIAYDNTFYNSERFVVNRKQA